MSNRVLNRVGARELTPEELERVNGATGTGCKGVQSAFPPRIDGIICSDSDS